MKKLAFMAVVAILMLAFTTKAVIAQEKPKAEKEEWPKPGPNAKVLLENEKIRVQEITYKPGEKSKMTERRARVIYYVKGGPTKIHYADGKTEKGERKTGTAEYFPGGDTKSTENVGKSEQRFIVINLYRMK